MRSATVEYGASYMGQAYDGITAVFFPFPRSEQDFGSLLMFVDDDEKPGVIRFESDFAPGPAADPLHAAFTKASPLLRCGGAPPTKVAAAPASTGAVATRPGASDRAFPTPNQRSTAKRLTLPLRRSGLEKRATQG